MTDGAYTIRIPRPSRLAARAMGALASALLGAGVLLAGLALFGSHGDQPAAAGAVYRAPSRAFQIKVPQGWAAMGPSELARVPSSPLAALHRSDHRGLIIVRASGPVRGDARALARALSTTLRSRFKSFRTVSARIVSLRAGSAFLYTFTHGSTVQSIVLTSFAGRNYTVESVSPGSASDVAQQIGASIGSFGP